MNMLRPRHIHVWRITNGRRVEVHQRPSMTKSRFSAISAREMSEELDRMFADPLTRPQLFDLLRAMCVQPPFAPGQAKQQVGILKRAFADGTMQAFHIKPGAVKPVLGQLGLPDVSAEAPTQEPPVAEKLGWFELTVVDAWGDPVGDVDLEISYARTKKKLTTPSDGKVRLENVDASFGSARFASVDDLREVLRPRWVKKPPETPPSVDNPTELAVTDDMGSVSLESEVPKTIVLEKPLTRVRLIGMHFDTNKSFMRKTAIPGIRRVVREYAKLGSGNLLVVGHTDTVAEEHYNLDLSVERAEAVKAYVKNDVPGWEKWFADTVYPDKKKWGEGEIAHMISALA